MIKAQHGGFITGMVIGLLIGLAVALGVALYITKAPVPFINKVPQRAPDQDAVEAERNKHWDPNAPLAGKPVPRPPMAASAPAPAAAASDAAAPAAAAPAGPSSRPMAAASAPAAASAARSMRDPAAILAGQGASATATPRAAASASVTAFFVQAGAYAQIDDAEAQRAKLALMGLGARITEREQSGRTVYRVRLGPFDGRNEAEDAQGKLSAAGIETNLVRVER